MSPHKMSKLFETGIGTFDETLIDIRVNHSVVRFVDIEIKMYGT